MGRAIKAILRHASGKGTEWEEIHDVPEGVDPETYIKKVIKDFNKLRDYDYELVRIVRMRRRMIHDWEKISLVTERGGYDKMRCRHCGITGKRYGMDRIHIDNKYKKADPRYCKIK